MRKIFSKWISKDETALVQKMQSGIVLESGLKLAYLTSVGLQSNSYRPQSLAWSTKPKGNPVGRGGCNTYTDVCIEAFCVPVGNTYMKKT